MGNTPNGPQGFATIFRDLGALVNIWNEIDDSGDSVEAKLTAAVQEHSYDYGTIQWLPTFINNVVSARSNLTTARANVLSSISSYFTIVTKVDIGSTATTASGVMADLIWHMSGSTRGNPSGICLLEDGVFHTFFEANYPTVIWPAAAAGDSLTLTECLMINQVDVSGAGVLPAALRLMPDVYPDAFDAM